MAYEIPGDPVFTLAASTGLANFRMVRMGTAKLAYPTAGGPITGALQHGGTTGSTSDPQYVSVTMNGVVKLTAPASTLAAGDLFTASSVGQPAPTTAGDYVVGVVIDGSSGGAGRVLTCMLSPIGTT